MLDELTHLVDQEHERRTFAHAVGCCIHAVFEQGNSVDDPHHRRVGRLAMCRTPRAMDAGSDLVLPASAKCWKANCRQADSMVIMQLECRCSSSQSADAFSAPPTLVRMPSLHAPRRRVPVPGFSEGMNRRLQEGDFRSDCVARSVHGPCALPTRRTYISLPPVASLGERRNDEVVILLDDSLHQLFCETVPV